MMDDTDKKAIGRFSNGALLYSLVNRAGVEYYTIEENGFEIFSTEKAPGAPTSMIQHYRAMRRVSYKEF